MYDIQADPAQCLYPAAVHGVWCTNVAVCFFSPAQVLLGDFGLAKQLQRTIDMARTPIGTPYYM